MLDCVNHKRGPPSSTPSTHIHASSGRVRGGGSFSAVEVRAVRAIEACKMCMASGKNVSHIGRINYISAHPDPGVLGSKPG